MVTVYLVSGIKLVGKVRQFDQHTVLLQGADGIDSLIFKHAISTYSKCASDDTGALDPLREKARVDRITAGGLSCKWGHSGE